MHDIGSRDIIVSKMSDKIDTMPVRHRRSDMSENEKLSYAIGRKIAELRKRNGLTQRRLADKIFTSDKNLSKWETGKALPDLEYLLAICDALGVDITYFTNDESVSAEMSAARKIAEYRTSMRKWLSLAMAFAALPIFIFAAARAYLPTTLPVHFDGELNADRSGWVGELSIGAFAMFGVTLALVACIGFVSRKYLNGRSVLDRRMPVAFGLSLLFADAVSLALTMSAIVVSHNAAVRQGLAAPNVEPFPCVFAALTGAIVWLAGCSMFAVDRNSFFGFRIPASLESDRAWRVYNATAGAYFCLYAFVFGSVMALLPQPIGEAAALCGALLPLLPVVALAYFTSRFVLKQGR